MLVWDVGEYEDEITGASWTTTNFPTIPGALYTLNSNPDLEQWTPINSFDALGDQLHLALFENNPSESADSAGEGEAVVSSRIGCYEIGLSLRSKLTTLTKAQ